MPLSKVSAVVLAAGLSRRMGVQNKLLMPWGSSTVVRRVVETVISTPVEEVVVVLGHDANLVAEALSGLNARLVVNEGFREGMGSSISTGVETCSRSADAFLIPLGDMPHVSATTIDSLLEAGSPGTIVAPVYNGRRGNPVLFGASFRDELIALNGDDGAKEIVRRHIESLVLVPVEDERQFDDYDTPEQFEGKE